MAEFSKSLSAPAKIAADKKASEEFQGFSPQLYINLISAVRAARCGVIESRRSRKWAE